MTVNELESDYVQFSVAGAASQLCPGPGGCSSNCVVTDVSPCQDEWTEPVYVVYKLLEVPPTPQPTVSPMPTHVPTFVTTTNSPTLRPTHMSPTLAPDPRPTRFHFPANPTMPPKAAPSYAPTVEPTTQKPLLSPTSAPAPAPTFAPVSTSTVESFSGESSRRLGTYCGTTSEWQEFGSLDDGFFLFKYILGPSNTDSRKVAVETAVDLPNIWWNTTVQDYYQPGIFLFTRQSSSGFPNGQTFSVTATRDTDDGNLLHTIDVTGTKLYNDYVNNYYSYDYPADENYCIGVLVFNMTVNLECIDGKCGQGYCQNGECQCDEGWTKNETSSSCVACAPGYVGPACDACPGPVYEPGTNDGDLYGTCNGFGNCTYNASLPFHIPDVNVSSSSFLSIIEPVGSVQCACEEGYRSDSCDECSIGYKKVQLHNYSTGQTFACLHCPSTTTKECSNHGTCVDQGGGGGTSNKYACSCDQNLHYEGESCSECVPGWAPEADCAAACPLECSSVGACSAAANSVPSTLLVAPSNQSSGFVNFSCTCPPNYNDDSFCANCSTGFYGSNCGGRCPGVHEDGSGLPCYGHGTCSDGKPGNGACSCSPGYLGNCNGSQCEDGYYSNQSKHMYATSCVACLCDPAGTKKVPGTAGVKALYSCSATQCSCKAGYKGPTCSTMESSGLPSQTQIAAAALGLGLVFAAGTWALLRANRWPLGCVAINALLRLLFIFSFFLRARAGLRSATRSSSRCALGC